MNAEQFVSLWKREKEEMMRIFLEADSSSIVAALVRDMGLSETQLGQLRQVLDTALTDTMYTLLLGLDGEASIGGVQHPYQLFSEDGSPLSGHMEEEAWKQFHGAD